MKESYADVSEHNKAETARLTRRAEALRNRLSKIYLDKLDGVISAEFWLEKHNAWTIEHAETLRKIEAYAKADTDYTGFGVQLAELLENLYTRCIQLSEVKKREVLKTIFSNFLTDARNIGYEYNKPFDIFAEGLTCSLD